MDLLTHVVVALKETLDEKAVTWTVREMELPAAEVGDLEEI